MTPDNATILVPNGSFNNSLNGPTALPHHVPQSDDPLFVDRSTEYEERSIETALLQRGDLCLVKVSQ